MCQVPGAGTSNIPKSGKWGSPEKSFQNAVQKCLFQISSALQSKVMAQPDKVNFAPCILPCSIGGSQNLKKEPYLSKTPFPTFVYLSKCNTKLPCIFGNPQKMFLWTGLIFLSIYFYYVYQIPPPATHLICGSMPVIDVEQHVGEQQWWQHSNG